VKVAELLAQGIEWWSYDGGEQAWQGDSEGAAALWFALLRHGRERSGCESEMERAVEARALSLHDGLTVWAGASIWPPWDSLGLPLVGH